MEVRLTFRTLHVCISINIKQVRVVFYFHPFEFLVGRYPGAQLGVGESSQESLKKHYTARDNYKTVWNMLFLFLQEVIELLD